MSRGPVFTSPFLIGFDQIERVLDRVSKSAGDGYPPYNIEQLGPDALRITLAVAGFSPNELQITLEDNQLVIRGKREPEGERHYLHRGIATRAFQRAFVLAEGMEVAGAALDNGLLDIDLVRPRPNITVKSIEITVPGTAQGPGVAPQSLSAGRSPKPEDGSAG